MTRYHGTPKQFTKNCEGCEYYKEFLAKDLCVWGVAVKFLIKTDNPRKCYLINENIPDNSILFNLNELERVVKSTYKSEQLKLFN